MKAMPARDGPADEGDTGAAAERRPSRAKAEAQRRYRQAAEFPREGRDAEEAEKELKKKGKNKVAKDPPAAGKNK
jgi:hypothetical protein